MYELFFLILLIIIAFLYSSVGHGGASGYLALMAIFGMAPLIMRPSALTLNLFVAGIAFVSFYRGGYFKWRILLPFLITSMPAAYIGASIEMDPELYKIILGLFLLVAVLRMLMVQNRKFDNTRKIPIHWALLVGAVLGFFSGMIGIGGGIILTPLLLVFHWASIKEAAAASALFIFMNSGAGLFSLFHQGFSYDPIIILWIAGGIIGGYMGSYTGSFKFSSNALRYVLAGVLIVASAKLFFF